MSFISELQRRNVVRVAIGYLAGAWLLIQILETLFPIFGLAETSIRVVVVILAIGFPIVLVLSWIFEWTPEGLQRDDGVVTETDAVARRRLDRVILVLLVLAVAYFSVDKFVLDPARDAEMAQAARDEGRTEAILESFGDRSIAVLPFVDMSPNKDQEYMSDGIAEELLNLLAKIRELRVISRSSAFSFKGKDFEITDVAEQLNAAYVLEGSVRTAGDQVRITAQLIDGRSDTHVWSNTYDRKLENIFDIQDDIAAAVVDELRLTLLGGAPKSRAIDPEAYKLILQARYFWNRRAPGDAEQVLEMYRQAIELVPDYAPAWSGLSVAYAVHAAQGRMDREEGRRLAREAAEKAVALDPTSAEALVRLGQALARARDRDGMWAAYNRAYELEPDNPLVLGVNARKLLGLGQFDKAIGYLERAVNIDPLGAIWPGNLGIALTAAGRFDEAEDALTRAFELNGNLLAYNAYMADVHIHRGDFDKAVEALQEVPAEREWQIRHAVAEYGAGNVERAEEIMAQMEANDGVLAPFGLAAVYAVRGDVDTAFEWLASSETLSRADLEFNLYFRNLRDDPRWLPYLESLGQPD